MISALRAEAEAMRILKNCVREPIAVYLREVSGGSNTLRVSIRQRVYGEARTAIAALFGGIRVLKHVYVFDEDIDIHDDRQVDWAMGTRFQADQDLVVLTGMMAMTMDPSLQGRRTGAKAGFDCTRPFGRDGEVPLLRCAAKVFSGPARYQTVEQALGSGPMFLCRHRRGCRQPRRPRSRLRARRIARRRQAQPRPRWPLSSRRLKARRDRHHRRDVSRPERGDVIGRPALCFAGVLFRFTFQTANAHSSFSPRAGEGWR